MNYSIYKLGRLVLTPFNEDEKTQIILNHKNSIGGKFILKLFEIEPIIAPTIITNEILNKRIEIFINILNECIPNIYHRLPENIKESTVIHLRLGDVVAGTSEYEYKRRPITSNEMKLLLDDYYNKKIDNINTEKSNKYIIAKNFFSKGSSINYDECIEKSNIYLNEIKELVNGKHITGNNTTDIDFCSAIEAGLFVQGRGYFSQLIVMIRKKLNKPVIEIPPFAF